MRPEFETILTLARSLDAEDVVAFLADLEFIRITALGVLLMRPAPPAPDELIDVDELAARLGVSTSYVYHHQKKYSAFAKHQGRTRRWSANGLARYLNKSK